MLEALEPSPERAQRQLVADASHELRTPLTSLRTNLELLARGGPPDPEDRDRLRADLVAQLEELSALVGDLVELARDDEPERRRPRTCASTSWSRPRSSAPAGTRPRSASTTELEPALVQACPARLDRAVAQPARQRGQVEPAGRRDRRAAA